MNLIREAAEFVKQVRKGLRRGALSQEPLTILRFEWKGDFVECDWLIRPIDAEGRKLPAHAALERQSEQAFRDALRLRDLVFDSFPAVMRAQLRMYRANSSHCLELTMSGMVNRLDLTVQRHKQERAHANAGLIGFEYVLTDGVLSDPHGNSNIDTRRNRS